MSANNSPLTGIIEETQVIIDFGQYEGQSVEDVRRIDPSFIDQLIKEKESQKVPAEKESVGVKTRSSKKKD